MDSIPLTAQHPQLTYCVAYLEFAKRVDLTLSLLTHTHHHHHRHNDHNTGQEGTPGGDEYAYDLDGGDGFTGAYLPLIELYS